MGSLTHETAKDLFEQSCDMYMEYPDQWPPAEVVDYFWQADVKKCLRSGLLHFADISNPMKPWNICQHWASLIFEEFFAQGDRERELKLQVQPLNDRHSVNIPSAQLGFIEFFVAPLTSVATKILPALEICELRMFENIDFWLEAWHETHPDRHEYKKVVERINKLRAQRALGPMGAMQSGSAWGGSQCPASPN